MDPTEFDRATAEQIIEQLRAGSPPPEHVRAFTVGRGDQLCALEKLLRDLEDDRGFALLVKANYGAGKSHFLKVVREMALESGYVVSLVVVETKGGVRFNRMDTILGAICRNLEAPGCRRRGLGVLLNAFSDVSPSDLSTTMLDDWNRISSNGNWGLSNYLGSPALYIALRAWVHTDDEGVRKLIDEWFENPVRDNFARKHLWLKLVDDEQFAFNDPRPELQFYSDGVFAFNADGHRQAWAALGDLSMIARIGGYRGVVVLFDEFEDVINLDRRDYQQQAFQNLFRFFDGDSFSGMSCFAVTPDFVAKCRNELINRKVYGFNYARFDQLPSLEIESVQRCHFRQLAMYIQAVYAVAYKADPKILLSADEMTQLVEGLWVVQPPDRVRQGIKAVVHVLDRRLAQI